MIESCRETSCDSHTFRFPGTFKLVSDEALSETFPCFNQVNAKKIKGYNTMKNNFERK